VLKALHKEPSRRYQSAEHLAEDVERYLSNRPVLAAPDSRRYRARKFIARHTVATAASMAAVLAVLIALGAALWQARRADNERDRAQARLTDIRRLASTLIFDVYDRVENSPNATTIRRSLVEQGLSYLDQVAAEAPSDPTVSLELAGAYRRLAEVLGDPGRSNLGDRDAAAQSLEKGRTLLAPFLTRADVPVDIAVSYLNLTRQLAFTVADQPDRAQRLVDEGLQRARRLQSANPSNDVVVEALAHTLFHAALIAKPPEQLALWEEANDVYRELVVRLPQNPVHLRNLALTERYIGSVHHAAKRLDLARFHYERALELDRQVQTLRPDNRQTAIDVAFDLGNVASVLWESVPPQRHAAAALYRESLTLREQAATSDPQDVYARQALGYCLMQLSELSGQLGEIEAAVSYGRRAVDTYDGLPPSENLARRGFAWRAFGRAAGLKGMRSDECAAFRRAHDYFVRASNASPNERNALRPETLDSVRQALETCPR
jgi:non-specific serine/threonine protein kinase/serine/threonine-protein kinase